jgi:glycosyltransferase involved in cell wall biosynthesis
VEKIPVSVVILAKNEEKNLEETLKSVDWSNDVIVVDDFSEDGTADIAGRYTDKVYKKKMEIEGPHRNWAYSKASNEWVLSLDADESVSERLKEELQKISSEDTGYNGFSVPLKNFIGDYWIRYGGWYPAEKLRVFKKSKFKYEDVGVHPRAFLEGECGHLKGDIIHKGYPDFSHFVDSINRQTTLEAEKWVNDKRPMSLPRAVRKGFDRFVKGYFFKRGYKDGYIGFMVAYFACLYQVLTYAKYRQLKEKKK